MVDWPTRLFLPYVHHITPIFFSCQAYRRQKTVLLCPICLGKGLSIAYFAPLHHCPICSMSIHLSLLHCPIAWIEQCLCPICPICPMRHRCPLCPLSLPHTPLLHCSPAGPSRPRPTQAHTCIAPRQPLPLLWLLWPRRMRFLPMRPHEIFALAHRSARRRFFPSEKFSCEKFPPAQDFFPATGSRFFPSGCSRFFLCEKFPPAHIRIFLLDLSRNLLSTA